MFVADAGFEKLLVLPPRNPAAVLLLMVSALTLGASPSMTNTSLTFMRRREEARKNKLLPEHLKHSGKKEKQQQSGSTKQLLEAIYRSECVC